MSLNNLAHPLLLHGRDLIACEGAERSYFTMPYEFPNIGVSVFGLKKEECDRDTEREMPAMRNLGSE